MTKTVCDMCGEDCCENGHIRVSIDIKCTPHGPKYDLNNVVKDLCWVCALKVQNVLSNDS